MFSHLESVTQNSDNQITFQVLKKSLNGCFGPNYKCKVEHCKKYRKNFHTRKLGVFCSGIMISIILLHCKPNLRFDLLT